MANLNIPFLLHQENQSQFEVDTRASRLIQKKSLAQDQQTSNLLVLSDANTGTLALCHQESILTYPKPPQIQLPNKFLVNIKPKVLCVPSIFQNTTIDHTEPTKVQLLDFCLVRSPAAKVLNTSDYLLVTIHKENLDDSTMRLWSTDDGRCVMRSPKSLFQNRLPKKLHILSEDQLPGLILCACQDNEILIINAFTMSLIDIVQGSFQGIVESKIDLIQTKIYFSILDQSSTIFVWAGEINTESQDSESISGSIASQSHKSLIQARSRQLRQCSSMILHDQYKKSSINHKPKISFNLEQCIQSESADKHNMINRGRGKHRDLICFGEVSQQNYVIVYQDRIEMVDASSNRGAGRTQCDTKLLLQYEKQTLQDLDPQYSVNNLWSNQRREEPAQKWFVFSQFRQQTHLMELICVDSEQNLLIFQVNGENLSTILEVNLFKSSHLFDLGSIHVDEVTKKTLMESQEELMKNKVEQMREQIQHLRVAISYGYFSEKKLLYCYLPSQKSSSTRVLTWSLQSLQERNDELDRTKIDKIPLEIDKIPLQVSTVEVFGTSRIPNSSKDPNCILNLNQYVTKTYFTRHQHSFFYSDEKITDQTFYVSSDFPSMVVGTNYGRIFVVQLFQDIERRAYPVVVIDCHNCTPITCLYIAYSSARRQKQANSTAFFDQQRERSSSQQLAQSISLDSGGHLIACSEDGTVSITNMNSGEVVQKLADFSLSRNEREIKRVDRFMRAREENRRQRRRQSVDLQFSTAHYFNLVRAEPFKVFSSLATGRLSRVLEVQALQRGQLDRQKYQQKGSETTKASPFGFEAPPGGATPTTALETAPSSTSLSADKAREAPLKSESPRSPGMGAKATANHYQHHLQSLRELFQNDTEAAARQSPLLEERMPFRASYACIDSHQFAVYVLQIQNAGCEVLRAQGLDSRPIGVYEDPLQNLVHVVTERNLNVYTYNQLSKQLLRKSGYAFAQAALQMNQTIGMLLEQQQYFKQSASLSEAGLQYEQHSFEQQFQDQQPSSQRGTRVGSSLHAAGHHKVLDYLSMSLSLPLYYHPHHILSQKYTKSVRDLLPDLQDFRACLSQHKSRDFEAKVVKDSLRTLITSDFVWNDRYKSDFSQEYYHAQGAVTPLMAGTLSDPQDEDENQTFRQQMIIINTKDMINIFKNRMKVLTESLGKVSRGGRNGSTGERGENLDAGPPEGEAGLSAQQQAQPNISADYLQNSKWPTRLLALVHPFTLDGTLDENLELFFGLSIPYVDFRIGVQGIDESFSFIIARDDRDKEEKMGDDNACGAVPCEESVKLLRLSLAHSAESASSDDMESKMVFVNSEYWKASSYMSTVMCSLFLGTLVSIVEYAQPDITTLMQDWLNVVQYITSSSSQQDGRQGAAEAAAGSRLSARDHLPKPLSVSALSQLMLRKDHSISSCARDVIMKPLLSSGSSIDHIKEEINEWQDLIMDTYLKLKEDASMRQAYDADASLSSGLKPPQKSGASDSQPRASSVGRKALGGKAGALASRPKSGGGPPAERPGQPAAGTHRAQAPQDNQDQIQQAPEEAKQGPKLISHAAAAADKSINHFFGELEIRGLVNLSYYALYSQDGPEQQRIETDVQNRLCKCTVILTREIMTKFTSNSKEHQNLLTILMQLLQTQMRAEVPTFKTKVIKEDVIKILLLIYDFYKKQLRDERFLTRVVAENFHLIHPKNSELYLKLTAAKTLLEIGTYFTEDFLSLIHEQATTLKDGPEYQRNVLDVLRYFINGSRDGLEPHLIQIVQTLLKCLDPNDEQLRKNSTQLISIILSTMVKSFAMIAFHHETQRLAVGTPGGPIAIYDVRTSQKWKILEGHQRNVLCVEFDQKGNLLASYSAADLSLRLWKVGNTGFFQTIMGGTGRSMKEIKLEAIIAPQRAGPLAGGRGRQRSNQQEPRKGGSQQAEPQVRCKIKFADGGKALQLTREDGSTKDLRL